MIYPRIINGIGSLLATIVLLWSLVARTQAEHGASHGSYEQDSNGYYGSQRRYKSPRSTVYYGGHYGGRCGKDGFYYHDDYSFVTCSHGIAYVQQCAPGTRNGAMESYSAGGYYTHTSFCDVNLVDYGYAAYHSQRRPYGGYTSSRDYAPAPGSTYGGGSYGGYHSASRHSDNSGYRSVPSSASYAHEDTTYGSNTYPSGHHSEKPSQAVYSRHIASRPQYH